jgi:hypothetical protein
MILADPAVQREPWLNRVPEKGTRLEWHREER